ncbi:MAG: glycosyltransferase [Elusimicrobiota bacterium]
MRLLHLVDEPYDSGLTAYALAAAAGLARRGHDGCVAGLAGRPPLEEAARLGLRTLPLGNPCFSLPRLRSRLKTEGVDIVLAHTGSAHSLAAAATLGLKTRIVRVRGDARPVKRHPAARWLWRRTAGFIAANRGILEDARGLCAGRPAAVVYQGIEDPGAPPPFPSGSRVVGILGRLDPVKGHAVFLRAAARLTEALPEARFLVAGREENVKVAELRRLIRELGLEERVSLLGHVPEVREFMRRCSVGVVASLGSEAVSRAALEWLSCGRPVAASAVGCLPETLEGCAGGVLVAPGDPDALCGALRSLLEGGALAAAGSAARRRYEERFTLGRFLDGTEALLKEALL